MFLLKVRDILNKDIKSESVLKAVFILAGTVLGVFFHVIFFYQILLNAGMRFFPEFFFLNVYKETSWYAGQIILGPVFLYLGLKLSLKAAKQRKAITFKK